MRITDSHFSERLFANAGKKKKKKLLPTDFDVPTDLRVKIKKGKGQKYSNLARELKQNL